MRLALSSIAWDVEKESEVIDLMKGFGVNAVEIVPGKYFGELNRVSDDCMDKLRLRWLASGIEAVAMQSLMFGTKGLNIFGTASTQALMLSHLEIVCRIGGRLGAKKLVFGSPKSRDISGLEYTAALGIAIDFMKRLARIAEYYGVVICLEPNPTRYNANFMTTSDETDQVVRLVNHRSIKMQFDTGSLTINHEDVEEVLQRSRDIIGHIHISEPDLLPLGSGGVDHERVSFFIKKYLPDYVASIEIRPQQEEFLEIYHSLQLACRYYQSM
jgi:sugar phosphate isomerase/epimerase